MSLRFAHLSDPHFSLITLSPKNFLSKRWMGMLNLALFRRNSYKTHHLKNLPPLMLNLDIDHVFITGDFTSTSLDAEFRLGQEFAHSFSQPTLTLPGNHDAYTKKSELEHTYYKYFPSEQLEKTRVEKHPLKENWWWVGLDCARANSLLKSNGCFYPEMEQPLHHTLQSIPKDHSIILANHFPLFPSGRPSHDTERGEQLAELLKQYPNVKLYIHGHDHEPYIIDQRKEGYPLTLNAGSCAHQPDGTFYVVELDNNSCIVERLLFTQTPLGEFSWVVDLQKHYTL